MTDRRVSSPNSVGQTYERGMDDVASVVGVLSPRLRGRLRRHANGMSYAIDDNLAKLKNVYRTYRDRSRSGSGSQMSDKQRTQASYDNRYLAPSQASAGGSGDPETLSSEWEDWPFDPDHTEFSTVKAARRNNCDACMQFGEAWPTYSRAVEFSQRYESEWNDDGSLKRRVPITERRWFPLCTACSEQASLTRTGEKPQD